MKSNFRTTRFAFALCFIATLLTVSGESRAQSKFDAVAAAGQAVVELGFKVAEVIGNVDRRGIIQIKNLTPYDLVEPKQYESSGSVHHYPLRIPSNHAHVVGVQKSQGSARGAVGVVTYKLSGTNYRLAICYSIPYDYNWYENWYKYSIISADTPINQSLYDDMYNNDGLIDRNGEIKKAASGFNRWKVGEFTMAGTMTNNGQSTLQLEFTSTRKLNNNNNNGGNNNGDNSQPNNNGPLADPGTLTRFRNQQGKVLQFKVTGSTAAGSVWGNGIYTDDSRLAAAAVHAGVLRNGQTGTVKVRILKGQQRYEGSQQNGVSSQRYGAFQGSFRFVGTKRSSTQSDPGNLSRFRNRKGQLLEFRVTGKTAGSVWGDSNCYTDDSTLAAAAVHAGVIRVGETKVIRVRILAGQKSYGGGRKNGVSSGKYGAFQGSFRFE